MVVMNRKRGFILILLLVVSLLPLFAIPIAKASSLTVSISSDYDDVWMTETGNVFSSTSMVIMLDDETGLRSFLRFNELSIINTAYINVATLRVFAGEVQPDSPGASVTIYGMDELDCGPLSVGGGAWSLSRPYTSASINWNLSSWPQGWHEVNVTSIVKEIVNQYAWSSGNSLGFQILGASDTGYEPRSFEDYYHLYHDAQAQLYIEYNVAPGTPDGLPDGAVFDEAYGEWNIWNYTTITGMANYTDMTQTGSLARLNVFNETVFNWTNINKNTPDVALGYFVNLTGPNPINAFEFDFNFTMEVLDHHGAQLNPYMIMVGGSLFEVGSFNDIWPGNKIIGFDTYTVSASTYRFLPRYYNNGAPTFGNYSGNLAESTWYMGKAILDGTKWRLEVRTMAGVMQTACQRTLPGVQDINTLMPLQAIENIDGSRLSGWMRKAPPVETTEFWLVDPNGTVIPTWNGENFTDIDDLKDWTDDYLDPGGGDPLDPDPGTQGWETEGPFTRFKMRLYILFIGLACVFTPLWAMAYRKFDSVGYAGIAIIMLMGVGLLWSITGI